MGYRSLLLSLVIVFPLTPCSLAGAQSLPMPLGRGALCGPLAPCALTPDLGGHLRLTFLFTAPTETRHMAIGTQLALSMSLWHWAELGLSAYGSGATLADGRGGGTEYLLGPLTLWARLSPPLLSGLFTEEKDQGLSLSAQMEYASARPPFDGQGTLFPDAETLLLVSTYQKGPLTADLAAGAQLAGSRSYVGGQGSAAVWLTLYRRLGLQLGIEAIGCAGRLDGEGLRLGWMAAASVRVHDEWGSQAGGGYVRGGGDLPAWAILLQAGYSVGPRYRIPPPPARFDPLLQEPLLWQLLDQEELLSLLQQVLRRSGGTPVPLGAVWRGEAPLIRSYGTARVAGWVDDGLRRAWEAADQALQWEGWKQAAALLRQDEDPEGRTLPGLYAGQAMAEALERWPVMSAEERARVSAAVLGAGAGLKSAGTRPVNPALQAIDKGFRQGLKPARNKPFQVSADNLNKMRQGHPPEASDGSGPVELHHPGQNEVSSHKELVPMSPKEHRLDGNYKKNHPHPQRRSQIDRARGRTLNKIFWKEEAKKYDHE